jgi:hypothetical protein
MFLSSKEKLAPRQKKGQVGGYYPLFGGQPRPGVYGHFSLNYIQCLFLAIAHNKTVKTKK